MPWNVATIPSADWVRPVPQVRSATITGTADPKSARTAGVQDLDRHKPHWIMCESGHDAADRQNEAGRKQQPRPVEPIRGPAGDDCDRDHGKLRDDDAGSHPARPVATADGRDTLAKQGQHRGVAEVEQQQSEAQCEQAAIRQHLAKPRGRLCRRMSARTLAVDRAGGDRDQRQRTAGRHSGQDPEGRGGADGEGRQRHQPRGSDVAGVVPRLVATLLVWEAILADDAECQRGQSGSHQCAAE
jgi:hypothetical protein